MTLFLLLSCAGPRVGYTRFSAGTVVEDCAWRLVVYEGVQWNLSNLLTTFYRMTGLGGEDERTMPEPSSGYGARIGGLWGGERPF